MGNLKWYKRDPRAALVGMMMLTPEERGIYNTILDLIYSHDNELPDDPTIIVPWLNTNLRVWKRVRLRLIELGKLYVSAGCLRNPKADEEVHEALARVASAAEAATKRWATYNEIKKLGHAPAMLPTPTPTNLTYLSMRFKKKED